MSRYLSNQGILVNALTGKIIILLPLKIVQNYPILQHDSKHTYVDNIIHLILLSEIVASRRTTVSSSSVILTEVPCYTFLSYPARVDIKILFKSEALYVTFHAKPKLIVWDYTRH